MIKLYCICFFCFTIKSIFGALIIPNLGSSGSWDGSLVATGSVTTLTVGSIIGHGWEYIHEENGDWQADGWGATGATAFSPMAGNAFLSGTIPNTSSVADHQNLWTLRSAATTNSGYYFRTRPDSTILRGGELFSSVFRPDVTNAAVSRLGFFDTSDSSPSVDAAELVIENGFVFGRTINASSGTVTVTSNSVPQNVFYRGFVAVTNDLSMITFILASTNGAVVWSDSITATIPASSLGVAVNAYTTAGAAINLLTLDKVSFRNRRTLNR